MSTAAPEHTVDLVAVACVVESSLLLASEWLHVLTGYVFPLLKRLNELHPTYHFRLAFVTYGAADTRPQPLLSKRFFAPPAQLIKELREEPSKLGIGQTNSGSGRGLSALEGLVAAIELFDVLMMSPQKEGRTLISHLLHIAASPPDNAQRPQWNSLQHLDAVNWDSIPTELKKRKINLSLISLRKIPQFQDLQSSVAGPGAQSPWFNVRVPHTLSLAGFPVPQKTGEPIRSVSHGTKGTKRQTEPPASDRSPDTKRQKTAPDTIPKPSPASPAPSPARTPQNQRPQQAVLIQAPQPPPTVVPSPAQPVQVAAAAPIPSSTPAATLAVPSAPSQPPMSQLPLLDQFVANSGLKFGQMIERFKTLDKEVIDKDSQIANAQSAGQDVSKLQEDRNAKFIIKEQLKSWIRNQMLRVRDARINSTGAAGLASQNGLAEAGPSTLAHLPHASSTSSDRSAGPPLDEQKPAISDSHQILAQFWQSRGGTISAPSGNSPQAPPSQIPSHPPPPPEVVAQTQRLTEMKGFRPPPSQPSGTATETSASGTPSTATNQPMQPSNISTWQGMLSATFSKSGEQAEDVKELQVYVIGIFSPNTPSDVRTDGWPKNFALKACKEPLKDNQELQAWIKHHHSRAHIMQFRANPRSPDGSVNERKFQELSKFMIDSRIFAYAGWQTPSGKFTYNIVIFPLQSYFIGVVFPDGIPDLPGGNILDGPPAEGTKSLPHGGGHLPPQLVAQLQTLDPARRKQFITQFLRAQQQDQLRRQQLLQQQQTLASSSQVPSSHGMPIPPGTHRAVVNMPPGLQPNLNMPANAGVFTTPVGGTVNSEMMQSFMQREGSTSQGTNPT